MKFTYQEIETIIQGYFPELGRESLDIFLSITKYHKAGNKEIILKGDKYNKNVIFILKGVARAYSINDNGEELNDYIRAQGHLIADAKVFGDDLQNLSVESIGEIHFLKFDMGKLEKLGYTNPELMKFYVDFLKEIILTLAYRLHTFVTMTPEERYSDLIKWNPVLIESTFDKHIASFLGITPLTIHRIKKKLKHIK